MIPKCYMLHRHNIYTKSKETYKSAIRSSPILNIYCITNTIILTSSIDKSIIKTDINKSQ